MTSKREQVISSFYNKLKTLESTNLKVYRNLDKPQKVPSGGMIVVRDGTSEEPEVLLNPLTYIYEHLITVEVMAQNADSALRSSQIDSLLTSIGSIINANRSLDGLAEWLEAQTPETNEEAI
jgi:hypothetical protein